MKRSAAAVLVGAKRAFIMSVGRGVGEIPMLEEMDAELHGLPEGRPQGQHKE